MATLKFWSLDATQQLYPSKSTQGNLLIQVKRAEKHIFARNEVFDFDLALKKRNANLAIILDNPSEPEFAAVAAYLIYIHAQRTVLLHKVCVLEDYRRCGIAKANLNMCLNSLRGKGCQKAQLWVDEANVPARCLYASVGFADIDQVEDYYAPGRTGIKMIYNLT